MKPRKRVYGYGELKARVAMMQRGDAMFVATYSQTDSYRRAFGYAKRRCTVQKDEGGGYRVVAVT